MYLITITYSILDIDCVLCGVLGMVVTELISLNIEIWGLVYMNIEPG